MIFCTLGRDARELGMGAHGKREERPRAGKQGLVKGMTNAGVLPTAVTCFSEVQLAV